MCEAQNFGWTASEVLCGGRTVREAAERRFERRDTTCPPKVPPREAFGRRRQDECGCLARRNAARVLHAREGEVEVTNADTEDYAGVRFASLRNLSFNLPKIVPH